MPALNVPKTGETRRLIGLDKGSCQFILLYFEKQGQVQLNG